MYENWIKHALKVKLFSYNNGIMKLLSDDNLNYLMIFVQCINKINNVMVSV